MTREQKLEAVVRAALRMRRNMRDFTNGMGAFQDVARADVKAFDEIVEQLSTKKEKA